MLDWKEIDPFDPYPRVGKPVLLCRRYTDSTLWMEPVYGWRMPPNPDGTQRWSRWHDPYPPTHYAEVNLPS